jgi:hypothetical protein
MNENAFEDLYKLFVGSGYRKSKEDFTLLLNENEQAYNDAFSLFAGAGYKKDEIEFAKLIGIEKPVKKKKTKLKTFLWICLWQMVLRIYPNRLNTLLKELKTL